MPEHFDRQKLIKSLAILLGLILIIFLLSICHRNHSMTLSEYELLQSETSSATESSADGSLNEGTQKGP